ncbi:UDP-N-acetylmuramoyl-tripeptide--D-alanyl-D-alanine ligase [Aliarcobacter vitoriensis]|uniref:Peptidoglycan synthetase n=1 Tax=Aliarcobacter vitoriensis TaxID=2011099 RepID=A0A366MWH6_9BACT|nr:peptidoglycan synthetase [Aliarcobacter vitoriensis]RBQ29970.1 peptidoglycan synthetase [Aliarcobacter vitoriensis]
MKISSILDIVDGKLLNSPSISFIYSIKTNSKKIKESDLYIAKDEEEVQEAIQNGAFAIIYEKDFIISDNEIAWIKVENIQLAMIKLIRFKLSTLNLDSFYCSNSLYDMLKIYQNNLKKDIFFIPSKIEKIFSYLDDIKDSDILISKNKEFLDKIYPTNKELKEIIDQKDISNLIEHSLFETSFSYKEHFFSRIKISSLYINEFINVFNFLQKEIDLSKLKNFLNMKAIFFNKNFEIVEFGKSDRFVICQDNTLLVENEIKHLQLKFKYAKSLFLSKNGINFLKKNEQMIINNLNELKTTIKNKDFHCIYLVDFSYKEVLEYFIKSQNHSTLF